MLRQSQQHLTFEMPQLALTLQIIKNNHTIATRYSMRPRQVSGL